MPMWKRGTALAQDILAPWAERVPDTGPLTPDELLNLPDDGWAYELVEGGWCVCHRRAADMVGSRGLSRARAL